VYEVLGASKKAVRWIGQVARHLLHPFRVGTYGNPRNLDGAGLDVDNEEDHVAEGSTQAEDFYAEEVTRVQGIPVHLDELIPGPPLLPFWRWIEAGLCQMVATVVRPISTFRPVRSASRILV
jgi:hypothetical protein